MNWLHFCSRSSQRSGSHDLALYWTQYIRKAQRDFHWSKVKVKVTSRPCECEVLGLPVRNFITSGKIQLDSKIKWLRFMGQRSQSHTWIWEKKYVEICSLKLYWLVEAYNRSAVILVYQLKHFLSVCDQHGIFYCSSSFSSALAELFCLLHWTIVCIEPDTDSGFRKWSQCGSAWNLCCLQCCAEGDSTDWKSLCSQSL